MRWYDEENFMLILINFITMKFNKWIATLHWVWPALVIDYIASNSWNMSIKELRKQMWIPYNNAMKYVIVAQDRWIIIWEWEPTKSWRHEKYSIRPDILEIKWEFIKRK